MSVLPSGWQVVTLDDLQADGPRAITDGPFGSNLTSAHYTATGPRVVRLQNIGDGAFIDAEAHIAQAHFETLRNHEVLPGDLLVASLGETLPRACLAPESLGLAIVKADCIRVRLSPAVEPRWVLYSMQRPSVRQWANEHRHGVGRPRLGLKVIRQIPVPLPPREEQRRIVDILEGHLSRLDAGRRELRRGAGRLQRLRASFLRRLSDADAPTYSLGDLAIESGYGTSTKCEVGGPGLPVVRIPNLVNGRIDLTDEKRALDASVGLMKLKLRKGDLLIVRTNGSRDLIGRSAVVRSDLEAAFASYLIRFRLDPDRMRPAWAHLVLQSPRTRMLLEGLAASSAGQYNLGLKKLHGVPIPCPPLDVQDSNLRQFDDFDWAFTRLSDGLESAANRSATFGHSLLEAAFSGALGSPLCNEEPTQELLDV